MRPWPASWLPRRSPRGASTASVPTATRSTCSDGASPEELLELVKGAQALIIRSATTVTAEVLAAGIRPGGRGSGRHRPRQRRRRPRPPARGVMVVNAPQSNVLSAAEHTMALLLAQARNVPQAHAALVQGRWERSRWTGVELSDKTLGDHRARPHRQARGAAGPCLRHAARGLRPVRLRRSGPPAERRAGRPRHLGGAGRLRDPPRGQDARDHRAGRRRAAAAAKPGLRIINVARGGIVDEAALAEAISAGRVAGAALDVFADEPTTDSPLFDLDQRGRHPPPRCQHPRGPGQGRRHDRRAGRAWPWPASSCPSR